MSVRFTKDHEWIKVDGNVGTVGITQYAQAQLGDIVFVEVPAAGKALKAGGEAAVVESVKAASEVYTPVSGTVKEGNGALPDAPQTVRCIGMFASGGSRRRRSGRRAPVARDAAEGARINFCCVLSRRVI